MSKTYNFPLSEDDYTFDLNKYEAKLNDQYLTDEELIFIIKEIYDRTGYFKDYQYSK